MAWWRNRRDERTRFFLFRVRGLRPAPPLRINALPANPRAPVRLPVSPSPIPEPGGRFETGLSGAAVTCVNVEQPPARSLETGIPLAVAPRTTGSDRVMAALPGVRVPTDGPNLADRLRFVLGLPLDRLLPGEGSLLEWPHALHPYQREGVEVLLTQPRVLLADDMGLGKTVQAITALRLLIHQRQVHSVLIVVPATLVDQWRREVDKWAPELRTVVVRGADRAALWYYHAHVKIVSYETLRSDWTGGATSGHPLRQHWDLVVLDEAQRIKNRDAEISQCAKRLLRGRSWALSGTPLENGLDDLASILEFVDHREDGSPQTYTPGPPLLQRHRELQLRRRKQDVLTELPPKRIVGVRLDLLPQQRAAYDRAERDGVVHLRSLGREVQIEHVLALITRLKQICNFDPTSTASAKLDDVRERMTELVAEGHRALLFSQYTNSDYGVGAAAEVLSDFSPLTFTGDMSHAERDRTVQQFRERPEHRMLILSLKAGGVGLNLQEASYVFHLDRWWNPAVERQAEDRVHRLGQTVPVTVFRYTCNDTIEERIERLLLEKQNLFDEIVDDVSIDLDISARLGADELFGLFGLEPSIRAGTAAARRTGLVLEERCASILAERGWSVERTPRTRDGGIDLIANRTDELGLGHRILMQCKDHAHPVGVEVVRELIGAAPAGETVDLILAVGGEVTRDARRLARDRGVHVWDGKALEVLEQAAPLRAGSQPEQRS